MKRICFTLVLVCICFLPACASLIGPWQDVRAAKDLVENKKFTEAAVLYQQVIRDHSDSSWAADAQYGLATIYVSAENPQRDYSQALHEFDEFVQLYPDDRRFQNAQNWRHALRTLLELSRSIEELKELDIKHEERRNKRK
jgi:tetratricopeptide (TPR) repeat protein